MPMPIDMAPEAQQQPDAGAAAAGEQTAADAPVTKQDLKELAARVVKTDISDAKGASDAEEAKRTRFYDLYRARGDEGKSDRKGRSTIPGSDVMNCIEWTMPDLMKAFAGGRKVIAVIPRGNEDVKKAEKIEKLLNWQLMHKCQGFLTLQTWIKAALVYGISHLKTGWEEQYDRKGFDMPEVMEPQMMQMAEDDTVESLSYAGSYDAPAAPSMQQGQDPNAVNYGLSPQAVSTMRVYTDVQGEQKIKVYSGPKLEVVPPDEFLIDPEALDVDTARYVIHRVKRTISYLRQKERDGIYSNIDKVISLTGDGGKNDTDNTEDTARAQAAGAYSYVDSASDGRGDSSQVGRRKVEVYEWWGELDVNGDGRTEPYLVVMCKDVILRMEKNPYAHGKSPFVDLCPIMDIFRYEGIGYSELAGPHQEIKTAIIRQVLDNVSFTNNQMWEVEESAGYDIDALAHPFPGRIVFTNRINRMKPITPAQLDANAYNLLEFSQGQLEQLTGITRYNQGMDANSLNKTATGISAIMNASSQRKDLIARTIAETGLRKLFMKMLQLDQQFVDQKIVIRLFNEPLEISPDDLAGDFDVSVDIGSSVSNDETQVEQLMTMLKSSQFLMNLGVMQPSNVFEICKKILDLWGYKNSEMYLSDPQDAEAAREAMTAITRLAQLVQLGTMPPAQIIAQVLQAAYAALAKIAGNSPGGGITANGGDNSENNQAGAGGSALQRQSAAVTPAVIAARYGRAGQAGISLPAGTQQRAAGNGAAG